MRGRIGRLAEADQNLFGIAIHLIIIALRLVTIDTERTKEAEIGPNSARRLRQEQVRCESSGEAHYKHDRDCHRDQVNGPGMIALTYKIDVS